MSADKGGGGVDDRRCVMANRFFSGASARYKSRREGQPRVAISWLHTVPGSRVDKSGKVDLEKAFGVGTALTIDYRSKNIKMSLITLSGS